jgi:hypothetical protein
MIQRYAHPSPEHNQGAVDSLEDAQSQSVGKPEKRTQILRDIFASEGRYGGSRTKATPEQRRGNGSVVRLG